MPGQPLVGSDRRHGIETSPDAFAAWGAPVKAVEVSIDGGEWRPATLAAAPDESPYVWRVWTPAWPDAKPGEHSITSRAIAQSGEVQPAMDDPMIAKKHTYRESNGQVTRQVRIA